MIVYRLTAVTFLLFFVGQTVRADRWFDYGEYESSIEPTFDDDSDQYLTALTRDEEQEVHSGFMDGYKYVSGGAGEGRQHLSPTGEFDNHLEVKTDEEMPSYCRPPNPCPLGFEGPFCDSSPMSKFTADYSRAYQNEQICQCDEDHDRCFSRGSPFESSASDRPKDILKRSRRVRRETKKQSKEKNQTNMNDRKSSHLYGETLRFHVAKKSPAHATS